MARWFRSRRHVGQAPPTADPPVAGGGEPDKVFSRDPLLRYDRRLVESSDLHNSLRRNGYAVLPPLIPHGELAALIAIGDEFLSRLKEPHGESFLTVGRITDAELRSEVTEAAGKIVRPHLQPLFVPGTEILGSPLQVKPPSPRSDLNPHQDASLLDEASWPGIYCWIPLVDVGEENGWLEVAPGSHRLGNMQRTLNVPWQFAGQEDVFRPHMTGLEMAAGSVCLFDSALVHGSPPNHSDDVRFAVNSFAKPPDAPMVHFFTDESTSPGAVEAWEIDVSFFLHEDIMRRPSSHYRSLGERPHVQVSLTDEELDAALLDLRPGDG